MRSLLFAIVTVLVLGSPDVFAQDAEFKDEFLGQFNASAEKLIALAEAMPVDSYDWRPMEGVASVADAYMHIARYNYYYPETSLGVETPQDIDLDGLENIEEKDAVVDQLQRSLDHVRTAVEAMSPSDVEQPTELYGRTASKRAVLLQLITHMNEHLGQQIAYARSNRVAPPWSQ